MADSLVAMMAVEMVGMLAFDSAETMGGKSAVRMVELTAEVPAGLSVGLKDSMSVVCWVDWQAGASVALRVELKGPLLAEKTVATMADGLECGSAAKLAEHLVEALAAM